MNTDNSKHRLTLQRIAHRVMLEKGLLPDFPVPALAELDGILGPATRTGESTRDLRNLLWCSIDNDDSDFREAVSPATSVLRSRTMHTPPPRTAGTPI